MAFPNAAYQIAATTNVPAYSAFGTETVIEREWQNTWMPKMPLLAMIYDGKSNWNKGSNIGGTRMLIPLMTADMTTAADGVTDANELTAISAVVTAGFTQAAFEIAHYRGATWIRESERRLINNERGNFHDGKIKQAMNSFANAIANDLSGATTLIDARANVVSYQQVLGTTTNTVGGIDQTTTADWTAQLLTGAGGFVLDLIDDRIDLCVAKGANPNLGLFSSTSTNNVWGKLKSSIGSAERITNNDFTKKYGVRNVVYSDVMCVMDNRMASTSGTDGRFYLMDTNTWYFRGDEKPYAKPVRGLNGTDADEYMFVQFLSVGCGNVSWNAGVQGITA